MWAWIVWLSGIGYKVTTFFFVISIWKLWQYPGFHQTFAQLFYHASRSLGQLLLWRLLNAAPVSLCLPTLNGGVRWSPRSQRQGWGRRACTPFPPLLSLWREHRPCICPVCPSSPLESRVPWTADGFLLPALRPSLKLPVLPVAAISRVQPQSMEALHFLLKPLLFCWMEYVYLGGRGEGGAVRVKMGGEQSPSEVYSEWNI